MAEVQDRHRKAAEEWATHRAVEKLGDELGPEVARVLWDEHNENAVSTYAQALANQEDEDRTECERVRELLKLDAPFPLTTVLVRLANACEHLLDDHDCDGDGHEGLRVAIASARESARALLSNTGGTDGE